MNKGSTFPCTEFLPLNKIVPLAPGWPELVWMFKPAACPCKIWSIEAFGTCSIDSDFTTEIADVTFDLFSDPYATTTTSPNVLSDSNCTFIEDDPTVTSFALYPI